MMKLNHKSGMTLIEVMAAVLIMSIIISLTYSGLVQTMNNKKRIEEELDRYQEIHRGLQRMVRELSMAFVSDHLPDRLELQVVKTIFHGKESTGGSILHFTSFSHRRLYRDAHESDQNELTYYVTSHPEDHSRDVLARREQNRIDDDPEKGGQAQILIDDVVEFKLQYLDHITGEWQTTWNSDPETIYQPNRLPSQVEITVTVPNIRGKGPDQTFGTRVMIPLKHALNHAKYRRNR